MNIDALLDEINYSLDEKRIEGIGPAILYFSADRLVDSVTSSLDQFLIDQSVDSSEEHSMAQLELLEDVTRRDLSTLLLDDCEDLSGDSLCFDPG